MHSTEPNTIVAGDTIQWNKGVDGYSAADGWSLHYKLIGPSVIPIEDQYVVASGGGWAISIPASVTVTWTCGNYTLFGWVTKAADSFKVLENKLTIEQDFRSQQNPIDNRSHVKKTLDALEAAIEGLAARQEASYSIMLGNGQTRTFTAVNRAELIQMWSHYQSLYRQEQQEEDVNQGAASGKRIVVRFLKP